MNTSLLYPCSAFPDSKDPDFPFKNGGMAGGIELKRPVGAHCHGAKALVCEDSVDKLLAKKKLYIASAVCLVFMIGEVIGKRLYAQTSGRKENRGVDSQWHSFSQWEGVKTATPINSITIDEQINLHWSLSTTATMICVLHLSFLTMLMKNTLALIKFIPSSKIW